MNKKIKGYMDELREIKEKPDYLIFHDHYGKEILTICNAVIAVYEGIENPTDADTSAYNLAKETKKDFEGDVCVLP